MNKDNLVYIQDILDAIEKIKRYCKGVKKQEFLKNELLMDGIVRNLEIMGEAVKRLSDEFRSMYPDIPWRKIAGMRDKIIHDYINVNYDIVWDAVKEDLPQLEKKLREIIKSN